MPEAQGRYRYKAFLSYAREDEATARRLHRALESYVLPRAARLIHQNWLSRRPVRPIFRDQEELVPGPDLAARLQAALEQSEYLIVICSPAAVASKWVAQEIKRFIALGRADRVLSVLVAGSPFAETKGLDAAQECLPGPLRADPTRPSALFVDWRGDAARRREPFLRIVAAMLELGSLDQLVRRDALARRHRNRLYFGGAIIVAALAWFAGTSIVEAGHNRSRAFATAAQVAIDQGKYDVATGYSILALPSPTGSLFDLSIPEARSTAVRANYLNDLIRPGTGLVSMSNDGRYGLALAKQSVELFDLQHDRRIGSYPWLEYSGLSNARFSDDGRYAVGPGRRGNGIMLVETKSGRTMIWPTTTLIGGFSMATDAPIAITNDAYSAANRIAIAVRAVPSGRLLANLPVTGQPDALAISAHGHYAAAAYGRKVTLWALASQTGRVVMRVPAQSGFEGQPQISFSPDERFLVVDTGQDGMLIDVVSGRAILKHRHLKRLGEQPFESFSTRNTIMVAPNEGDGATVWDLRNPSASRTIGRRTPVEAVSVSTDGKIIATASPEGRILLWDTASGRAIDNVNRAPGRLGSMRFAVDAKQLILEGISLWDASARRAPTIIDPSGARISDVAISHDGGLIAGIDDDGALTIASRSGAILAKASTAIERADRLAFSPDDRLIALHGPAGVNRIFLARSGREATMFANGLFNGVGISAVAFAPDGRSAAIGLSNATIALVDLRSGAVRFWLRGHGNEVQLLAYSPDGHQLASGSLDLTVRLWNSSDGTLEATLAPHNRPPAELDYARDGRRLLVSYDGGGSVWDTRSAHRLQDFPLTDAFEPRLRFAASDRRIIASTGQVWDGRSYELLTIEKPSEILVASSTGSLLVSRELKLWDAIDGNSTIVLKPGPSANAAAVAPGDAFVVGGFDDGTLRIWVPPLVDGGRALSARLCRQADGRSTHLSMEDLSNPLVRTAVQRSDAEPCATSRELLSHFWHDLFASKS